MQPFQTASSYVSILCAATTEVFLATVEKGGSHVMVTCHFTEHSMAKGCIVYVKIVADFTLSASHEEFIINRLTKSKVASRCIQIPAHSYAENVVVKDWKVDGRTGSLSVATFTNNQLDPPCKLVLLT